MKYGASKIPFISRFVGAKYSIRTKLILIYLLAATLPLIVISLVSYSVSFRAMQRTAVDTFSNVADQLNNNIELILQDGKNSLKIAQSKQVQDFLYQSQDPESKYQNAFEVVELFKSYRNFFDFTSYIANVTILNKHGSHFSEHQGVYDLPIPVEELEIVQEIMKNPDQVSIIPTDRHPYMKPDTKQEYLSICSVIRKNVTHEELGYMIVNIHLDTLQKLVDTISLQPPGDFFIVAGLDRFVYPKDFRLDENALPAERIKEISEARRGFFTETYQEVRSFFVFNTLDSTGWKIIGRSDSKHLLANAMTIKNTTIAVLLVTMTLSLLFYGYISSRLTYPIRNLKQSMVKVGQGDLDLQTTYQSKNEVADLTNSFNSMVNKIRALLELTKEEQQLSKKMEFRALQAQINPHFLYNSLESILWMTEAGKKDDIIKMTKSLSNFFRLSLSKGDYKIPIGAEIAHVENYLIIQQLRYRDILSYVIDVPESLYKYSTIKIVLQPIVENALYHGIKNKREMGLITIRGHEEEDVIVLEVEDNGMGMQEEEIQKIRQLLETPLSSDSFSSSYGMRNIHQRLKLEYGDGMGISLRSGSGLGTVVSIRFSKELSIV